MALGVSIASNEDFLGQGTASGKVLYIDFELSHGPQRQRLEQICSALQISAESLKDTFFYISPGMDEDIPTNLKALIPLLLKDQEVNEYELIIIDSVGAALDGDPESAGDICALLQSLRPLGTVLLLDHQSKKQRGEKSRDKSPFGSVYKTNLSRNVWHLNSEQVKTPDGIKRKCQLTHKKTNFTAISEPISFELAFSADEIAFTVCELGEEMMEHATIDQRIMISLNNLKTATCNEVAEDIEESLSYIKVRMSLLNTAGKVIPTGDKDGRASIYRVAPKEEKEDPKDKGTNVISNVIPPASSKGANTSTEQGSTNVISKRSTNTNNDNETDEPSEDEQVELLKNRFGAEVIATGVDMNKVPF